MSKKTLVGLSLARTYEDRITEQTVKAAADAMVTLGLTEAGYGYLIVGDGIFAKRRDSETGELLCDKEKFPKGAGDIADYLHERGIGFGVLTSAGAVTVNGAPGCHENEYHDAATLASWGVDYVAYNVSELPKGAEIPTLIRRMGMAVRLTGRDMALAVYSDFEGMHKWIRSTGASSYCCRKFEDAAGVSLPDESIAGYSAEFCLNSLGDVAVRTGSSDKSLRTQLALSAIMSSPIIVDCDPLNLNPGKIKHLTSSDVISIATDAEYRPARRLADGVYAKFMDNRQYAVAFVNAADESKVLSMYTYDFGLTRNCGLKYEISPVFEGEVSEYDACIKVKLDSRNAALYKMTLNEGGRG